MNYEITDDAYDNLSDELKDQYKETDGKYILIVDGMPKPKAPTTSTDGLKTALAKERAANKRLKNLGKTPEEMEEMLSKENKREEDELKRKGQYEELTQKNEKKWKDEIDIWKGKYEASEKENKSSLITGEINKTFSKYGFTKTGMDFLPDKYFSRAEVTGETGNREIVIKDKSGNIMINATGGNASFDDLAKEAVEAWPDLVSSNAKPGAGAPSTSHPVGSKTMLRTQFDQLDPSKKFDIMRKGEVRVVDAM